MRAVASGCRDPYQAAYQVIQQKPRRLNYKLCRNSRLLHPAVSANLRVSLMHRVKTSIRHFAILLAGIVAGFAMGFTQSHTALWNQVADRETHDLKNRINILSQLRLNQNAEAIQSLEAFIDTQVVNIAYAEDATFEVDRVQLNSTTIRSDRLRALQMAKAYRAKYPSIDNRIVPSPTLVLAEVPPLSAAAQKKECTNAFCTLFLQEPDLANSK